MNAYTTPLLTSLASLAITVGAAHAQQAIRVAPPPAPNNAPAESTAASEKPRAGQPWVATAPAPGTFYDDHSGEPLFFEPLRAEAFVPPPPPGQLPFHSHLGVSANVRKVIGGDGGADTGQFYTAWAAHWATEAAGLSVGLIPARSNTLTVAFEVGPYYGAELGSPARGVKVGFLGPGLEMEVLKNGDAPIIARLGVLGLGLGLTSSGDSAPPVYVVVRGGSPAFLFSRDASGAEVGYFTFESGIAFF